jgi:hypothetical protein
MKTLVKKAKGTMLMLYSRNKTAEEWEGREEKREEREEKRGERKGGGWSQNVHCTPRKT